MTERATMYQEHANGGGGSLTARPRADLHEVKGGYMLSVDLPGVSADSLEISLEDRLLSIAGTCQEKVPEDHETLRIEVRPRSYARSFELGPEIDLEKIEASFNCGLLRMKLPRRNLRKRTIPIRSI